VHPQFLFFLKIKEEPLLGPSSIFLENWELYKHRRPKFDLLPKIKVF
jgi:hypothetical protein